MKRLLGWMVSVALMGGGGSTTAVDDADALVDKVLKAAVYVFREGAVGSGFVVDPSGYILTNHHVIAKMVAGKPDINEVAERIFVKLWNNEEYPVKVIGHYVSPDCALLKIEAKEPLPWLPLGDSNKVKTGDKVLTVGQPHGLEKTVTSGIVSNPRRAGTGSVPVIQTDAPINPGNSGGPLVNAQGEVVGINTYKGQGEALGYAVPINYVKTLKDHYMKYGHFRRSAIPWVFFDGLTERTAKMVGVKQGAVVSYLLAGSPAEKAGFRLGDVITEMGEMSVATDQPADELDFHWHLATQEVGRSVGISGVRQEGGRWMPIRLTAAFGMMDPPLNELKEIQLEDLKVGLKNLNPLARIQLNVPHEGVLVSGVGPGTFLHEAKLQAGGAQGFGDVVTAVQKKPVKTAQDFEQVVQESLVRGEEFLWLTVYRKPEMVELVAKPTYPLKDQQVLIVLPSKKTDENYLKLMRDRLARQGASVKVAGPAGVGEVELSQVEWAKYVGVVVLDGEGVDQYASNPAIKGMIAEMTKAKHVLAGSGKAPAMLVKADPKTLAAKKLTFDIQAYDAELRNLNMNYTNALIEEDGNVVTSDASSEKTFKAFINRVIEALVRQKSL